MLARLRGRHGGPHLGTRALALVLALLLAAPLTVLLWRVLLRPRHGRLETTRPGDPPMSPKGQHRVTRRVTIVRGTVRPTLELPADQGGGDAVGVLLVVLGSWLVLSVLGLLGTAAVCRAGHVEDVARGFADADPPVRVPAPRSEQAPEVTRR